jgi:hypothetical protein
LPNCTGWSNCNPGRVICTIEDAAPYSGPTVFGDFPDGLSSDGRGPYISGKDGVGFSFVVQNHHGLSFSYPESTKNPRTLTVNLNNPVPGGGGVPLGVISVGNDNDLYTAWQRVGNVSKSMVNIPVGQTVSAAQMMLSFHLNGRLHLLQMGPQGYGHCHQQGTDSTRVHGTGTSSGTIYRASQGKWVVDLPAGSVGRLFDISHTASHAADKGLYYFRLHYEIDGVPSVIAVLGPLLETRGAAGVVARYRALKRDSAQAYRWPGGLNPIGYRLLDKKKPQDAVIVFRLSVEEYPDDWSPYDGLGQSYLALADTSKAIANYRRSLELNPKNQNAADVLKRLGTKP